MANPDLLEKYRHKRNFSVTPEPADGGKPAGQTRHALAFVVQKHWASRLHYDFRLEFEGTLKSWAVPKGPSLDPHDKRMAVQVEDHPLAYGSFEGTIPAKQYGAGQVIVWDSGSWLPLEDPAQGFLAGKLKFELHGHKLQGRWALVRMRGQDEKKIPWLLIKERDEHARPASQYDITEALPDSVKLAQPAPAAQGRHAVPADNSRSPARPRRAGARPASTPQLPLAAVKAGLPPLLAPQLASLVASPPDQGDWRYELKFDGYRLLSRIDGAQLNCFTRNGHDWTAKLPQLAKALHALKLGSAWLDGEIVVTDADGVPDFQALQRAFEGRSGRQLASPDAQAGAAADIVYQLFDLPFYAGHDLRAVPLLQRRALLKQLLQNNGSPMLRFSDSFDAPPTALMASACKLGLEGLMGKRADAPYQSRRTSDWIKLKCAQRQEFVICGYSAPKGSRSGLGALLLGVHDASGKLQYAGKVGSGFTEKTLADLTRRLEKIKTAARPFASTTAIPGEPHWVRPMLMAEVSFAEWTASGHIRHAVFRGLSSDKKPHAITREKAMQPDRIEADSGKPTASTMAPSLPRSLRITHPERVIDGLSGVTKLALIQHYAAVADLMLAHLKGRPVSLVRAPTGVGGELFFQKHAKAGELPGVKLLAPALDPGHDPLLEIASAGALLSAAQMNTLEFHTWNASASRIDRPDRMTFDLDPGEQLPWQQMQEAATLVCTLLEELGLLPFLKTSGGKGLHLVVPLKRMHDWDTVKGFSQAIVQHLASTIAQRFVAKSGPKNRLGKVFVDYLRNGFGATTVSAWSARARPGLGVSVPVAWDELAGLSGGAHWTVTNLAERIAIGNTPWSAYAASARNLNAAMKIMHFKP